MSLSDSTKRALRTLFHSALALVTVVPALLALLPSDSPLAAKLATVAAGTALVSKLLNALEERGLIPTWLKGDATVAADPVPQHAAPDVAPAPVEDAGVDPGTSPGA